MNNFEKLHRQNRFIDIANEYGFDVTLAGFEPMIDNDFIQLEAEWLNDINFFSRKSNKLGITSGITWNNFY